MRSAKDLHLRPIPHRDAADFIRTHHYSHTHVRNSQISIGVYDGTRLEGALQLGPPLDKRKLVGLVADTPWNGLLEINRMALTDRLPRNSESRTLAITIRLLRRHAPHVQWVVSFADAAQCGNGTIYRAAGFHLTNITTNRNLARLPDGTTIHKMTLESSPTRPRPEADGRTYYDVTDGRYNWTRYTDHVGATILPGHQLRYIYFIHPTAHTRYTGTILPNDAATRLPSPHAAVV